MAVLAPPVQVVTANAPPFVHVPSGAPPFVVTTGPAPPIQIVASGAPPITLFNEDGSIWSPVAPVGGAGLLVGEADGFATDFTYATDASRVALKAANVTTNYAVDAFYAQAGTSPKMVYDAAGTLGWSPHNLLVQSQTFDNASWGKENSTVTVNAVAAPDGTMTADKLAETAVTDRHDFYQQPTLPAGVHTFSAYVKAAERTFVHLFFDLDAMGRTFDLTAGTVAGAGGANPPLATGIQSVGGGWYRCSITFNAVAGTVFLGIYASHDSAAFPSYLGVVGSGLYVWGAQCNKGTVPTAYLPTTIAARVGLALDYDPVTHAARGLLCEPQATNLVAQSAGGRAGFLWTANGSTLVGGQADPAGGLEALQVTTTANVGVNVGSGSPVIVSGTTYTASMWCKGPAGQQIYFVMDTTALAAMQKLITFTGAWQRVSHTYVGSSTGSVIIGFETYNRTTPASPLPNVTFTIWGGQYEAGTVATSYIPTLAATVTRAGDQVKVTPASINYSTTAGSWWADVNLLTGSVPNYILCDANNNAALWAQAATTLALYDATVFLPKTVSSILGAHKLAAAFQSADRAVTADGLAVATDTTAGANLLSPGVAIGFGFQPATGTTQINGYIRKLRYLPRRKTNAELVTETT